MRTERLFVVGHDADLKNELAVHNSYFRRWNAAGGSGRIP